MFRFQTMLLLIIPHQESVLNGRLEPVSTVEGFTAEIGASGSFCPRHITLPVTVFFYTLQDMDKVTSPYMVCHLNRIMHFASHVLISECVLFISGAHKSAGSRLSHPKARNGASGECIFSCKFVCS